MLRRTFNQILATIPVLTPPAISSPNVEIDHSPSIDVLEYHLRLWFDIELNGKRMEKFWNIPMEIIDSEKLSKLDEGESLEFTTTIEATSNFIDTICLLEQCFYKIGKYQYPWWLNNFDDVKLYSAYTRHYHAYADGFKTVILVQQLDLQLLNVDFKYIPTITGVYKEMKHDFVFKWKATVVFKWKTTVC